MSYRFTNQKNPQKLLQLTTPTWFGLLSLAEQQGWNPMGTLLPQWELGFTGAWLSPDDLDDDPLNGSYTGCGPRLVVIDDSLNLADALEKAALDYEPQFRRSQEFGDVDLNGVLLPLRKIRPSLGAMEHMVDFCRMGAFCIEHLG